MSWGPVASQWWAQARAELARAREEREAEADVPPAFRVNGEARYLCLALDSRRRAKAAGAS